MEPERRTAAFATAPADLAAHQLDQTLADREAQAGAAVTTRGRRIRLAEALEQYVLPLGRHADARIGDAEQQTLHPWGAIARWLLIEPHGNVHVSLIGELHTVADEIQQHLTY